MTADSAQAGDEHLPPLLFSANRTRIDGQLELGYRLYFVSFDVTNAVSRTDACSSGQRASVHIRRGSNQPRLLAVTSFYARGACTPSPWAPASPGQVRPPYRLSLTQIGRHPHRVAKVEGGAQAPAAPRGHGDACASAGGVQTATLARAPRRPLRERAARQPAAVRVVRRGVWDRSNEYCTDLVHAWARGTRINQ